MQTRFNRKTIRRGLNIFFGLSIACLVLIFVFTGSAQTIAAFESVQPWFLVIAVALTIADLLGGGLRMWVLTRGLPKPLSYASSLRAGLASIAMGAVTPSQAGGGPAMVFILYRKGLTFAESMSAGLMSFVVTVVFYLVSAVVIIVLGVGDAVEESRIGGLFRYGLIIFVAIGATFIVFTIWPRLLRRLLEILFNFMSRFRSKHYLRPEGRARAFLRMVEEFHDVNQSYLRHRFPELVGAMLVTAAIFTSKCFIAYFIVRGLGVEAGAWEVVSTQVLILLAVYFFPTPGGTGAAEIGAAVLMANIVPRELLPVYVVLWRVILMYVAVIAGSIVMIQEVGQDTVVAGRRPGELTVEKKIEVSGE